MTISQLQPPKDVFTNNQTMNCTLRVAQYNNIEWTRILLQFKDATIYQTWAYGAAHWGAKHLAHVLLVRNGVILSAVQCVVLRLPFVGGGVAYIYRGPMWKRKDRAAELWTFSECMRALVKIYVKQNGLLLRVKPGEILASPSEYHDVMIREGFRRDIKIRGYHTLLLDLTQSLDCLRLNLKKKWRENLNRAMRNNMEIVEGNTIDYFNSFIDIYKEMCERKLFVRTVDICKFRQMQIAQEEPLKVKVLLARYNGDPVAGIVFSAIGDTGITLFSATGNKGMQLRGSYLLRWHLVERLKEMGCRFLDQGGINSQLYPTGYHFKAGMGGREVHHIGQYECFPRNVGSRIIWLLDRVRVLYRECRVHSRLLDLISRLSKNSPWGKRWL